MQDKEKKKKGVNIEVAQKLTAKSKQKIKNKIKHFKKIVKLIKIIKYELKYMPNVYTKSTKKYFDNKKLYATIIESIKIITSYLYKYEDIANIIIYPFSKLLMYFLSKEVFLLKFFDINAEAGTALIEEFNKENYDYLNKEKVLEIMMNEINKFSFVYEPKQKKSVYSLYIKNNQSLINNIDTPFSFISGIQDKSNSFLYTGSTLYEKNSNFEKYVEWTKEQIEDTNNYVIINTMSNNPKLGKYYFREIFSRYFIQNFFRANQRDVPYITNFIYKIASYNNGLFRNSKKMTMTIKNFSLMTLEDGFIISYLLSITYQNVIQI